MIRIINLLIKWDGGWVSSDVVGQEVVCFSVFEAFVVARFVLVDVVGVCVVFVR